jgi:hypothetical protein
VAEGARVSIGADRVQRALSETAEFLESIADQAMRGINAVRRRVHMPTTSQPRRLTSALTLPTTGRACAWPRLCGQCVCPST